jgi:hypothetical protein
LLGSLLGGVDKWLQFHWTSFELFFWIFGHWLDK